MRSIRCNSCYKSFVKLSRDFILALPIRENTDSILELQDILDSYFQPETLIAPNLFACPDCKSHEIASIKILIQKSTPDFLILSLNRFNNNGDKILTKTCIPDEINLKVINSEVMGEVEDYQLVSCIVHNGSSLRSGHYYLTFKNNENKWVMIDDKKSSVYDINNVSKSSTPYIYFYKKKHSNKDNNIQISIPENIVKIIRDDNAAYSTEMSNYVDF
jgi:ubiquitin C-terminal hydrolase